MSISDQGSSITSTNMPDHPLIPWNSCRNNIRNDLSTSASSSFSSSSSAQSADDYFGVFVNQLAKQEPSPVSCSSFSGPSSTHPNTSWPIPPQQQHCWPGQHHHQLVNKIYGEFDLPYTGCSVDSYSDSSSSSGYHDMLSPEFQCI